MEVSSAARNLLVQAGPSIESSEAQSSERGAAPRQSRTRGRWQSPRRRCQGENQVEPSHLNEQAETQIQEAEKTEIGIHRRKQPLKET